ncbi:hypothetical protein CANTEDRAFT_116997 [Yamadazyma tenuis ATCC 10573]|uniref:PCI domain-containing protein n=1 Tax=Candida tenuis (strain ATCC 10573 / BCRC 21748 / CBS 615 / JCM 9827 / NBRC 10315 / NRRL Y-1498 / VKM Y-70) TaxID=590646 RepID=G3BDD6_CANTC|nr:uncharacterized protein CANTEDRAFT_116997 [Yamadazyma tenuis ATCC 10573]EGV60933.1 hypothetical protein CANTEDRAFT_116997 [Yamadazyma tenuis ATCC 10573]
MSTLSQYLSHIDTAIKTQDSRQLSTLIEINPPNGQGPVRSQFQDPNDFDLFAVDEKFRPVVVAYLKLLKAIYVVNDIKKSFNNYIELVNTLNRAANTETNWINLPLMKACKELMDIFGVMEKSFPEEVQAKQPDSEFQTSANSSSLEILASTINNSFKLSLNDKNLDLKQSKRVDIYFFLGCLLRLYFRLNTLDMAKSVEKALKGTRFELPKFDKHLVDKSSAITYLYYSAILSLDDSEFNAAHEKLEQAMSLLAYIKKRTSVESQMEKLLVLYLPLTLYTQNKYPKPFIWKEFPILNYIYNESSFNYIKSGDVNKLNWFIQKFESFLLKKKLYLLFESLKDLCYINLLKKTVKIHAFITDSKGSHIVPFSAFTVSFNLSNSTGQETFNKQEIECILAVLISKGRIKGYLSHGNGCIVLSKTVPFPPLSS